MYRKRLLGLFTTILLGLSAGPAAALGTATVTDVTGTEQSVTATNPVEDAADEVVTVVEESAPAEKDNSKVDRLAAAAEEFVTAPSEESGTALVEEASSASGPEVDEEIEGVGSLLVDIDEEEGTLTVGVGIEPLGIEEQVTLPPAGGGDDEEPAEPAGPSEQDTAAANDKAAIRAEKQDAAKKAARTPTPAFSSGSLGNISGSVDSGTGVASSTLPVTAPSDEGSTASGATDAIVDAAGNPWLRLMGVVMLAGTSTAWSVAKRQGLA